MKNLQKFMKQAEEMQTRFAQMQAKLEEEETEGSSGGGMVRIVLNGKTEMKRLSIDESLLAPSEKEVLEDLVIAAFNDAKAKVESNFNAKMGEIAGGLSLPPGFKMPF